MVERTLAISAEQLATVLEILRKHVPGQTVWAFGSRVKGTAKPYSDLDICVLTDTPLELSVLAALADDFSESDLPWRVDIVDWASTGASFRQIIAKDKMVLQHNPSNSEI